jgi:hypothetical protein
MGIQLNCATIELTYIALHLYGITLLEEDIKNVLFIKLLK